MRRGGAVLAERALLLNNAVMGAQIAIELSKLEGFVFLSLSPIYCESPFLMVLLINLLFFAVGLGELKQPYDLSRP